MSLDNFLVNGFCHSVCVCYLRPFGHTSLLYGVDICIIKDYFNQKTWLIYLDLTIIYNLLHVTYLLIALMFMEIKKDLNHVNTWIMLIVRFIFPTYVVACFNWHASYSCLCRAGFMFYIVERAKKCLDFSATLYIIHLFICIIYGGWPSSITWWAVNGTGLAVMALLGEYLCFRREWQEIQITRYRASKKLFKYTLNWLLQTNLVLKSDWLYLFISRVFSHISLFFPQIH